MTEKNHRTHSVVSAEETGLRWVWVDTEVAPNSCDLNPLDYPGPHRSHSIRLTLVHSLVAENLLDLIKKYAKVKFVKQVL